MKKLKTSQKRCETNPMTSSETPSRCVYFGPFWRFCESYPINQQDSEANVPGVLLGRYAKDHYGHQSQGNPWASWQKKGGKNGWKTPMERCCLCVILRTSIVFLDSKMCFVSRRWCFWVFLGVFLTLNG